MSIFTLHCAVARVNWADRRCLPVTLTLLASFFLGAPYLSAASILPKIIHVGALGPTSNCNFADVQSAIGDAAASGDTIVIDGGQSYGAQNLLIQDKSLTIKAGPCSLVIGGTVDSIAANPQVTLSGSNNSGAAVLSINGNSTVTLIDLKITGAVASGDGGGIAYSGVGTLTLQNVLLTGNQANNGGGIHFVGNGGQAKLILDTDSQVIGNTARDSGGGIFVAGQARLEISALRNLIYFNHAPNGNGGGIEVFGAVAIIDSPGVPGVALIGGNDAQNGGGIAIVSTPDDSAQADISAQDPNFPVRIEGNNASSKGGGIYMLPNGTISAGNSDASLYANSFRIDYNTAVEGSAIYEDCMSSVISCFYTGHVYLSAGPCSINDDCNTIDHNETEDSNSTATPGAAILNQNGYMTITGVRMRNNAGKYVIRSVDNVNFYLADSLFAENQLTAELITSNDGSMTIDQCTFANDVIGAQYSISSGGDLTLTNSVFGEEGTAALTHGSALTANNIVAKDSTGLPSSPNIVQADPLFFDIDHGDYRLRAQTDGITAKQSPAIDFAEATSGADHTDIARRARDVDVPAIVDRFGPRDLGAYEMQPIVGRIFASGFGDPYQLVE